MNTVTDVVPPLATSVAGIKALSCVLLRNVVPRSRLFHRMLAPETKFVPLTVISKPCAPVAIDVGLIHVIAGTGFGGETVKANVFVAVAEELSLTCTLKLKIPAEAGVPPIVPFEEPRANPPGRDPPLADHVYGVVPPEAARVCE